MAEARLDIRFRTQGGQQSAAQVEAVQSAVKKARDDVESFKKGGGLGAIAVGADKIREAQARVELLGSELLDTEIRASGLRAELSRISQEDINSGQADGLLQQIARTEAGAAGLRKELALIPRDLREQTSDSVGYLGDIDSSLQAIGGAADEFGRRIGGAVGGGLQVIATGARLGGELFAVAEAAPRLFSAVDQLRANILKAAAAATAQSAAETAGTATTGAATVAEGRLALARSVAFKTVGVGAAGALGFAAAVGALQVAFADGRKEADRAIAAERDRIEAIQAVRKLTADATQERIDDLNEQIALETEARDNLIAAANEQLAQMGDIEKAVTGLNQEGVADAITDIGVLQTGLRAVGGVLGETGLNDTITEIDSYNDSIRQQEEELRALNAVAQARSFVSDLRAQLEAEQELNRLRGEGTTDEIQGKIDAAEQDRQLNAQLAEAVRNRIGEIEQVFENPEGIPIEELQALDEEWKELRRILPDIETAMEDASQQAQQYIDTALPAAQAREAEAAAIEATRDAIEAARNARERENEALQQEVETLAKQSQQAAEAVRSSSAALAEYEAELEEQASRALRESVRASQVQALETEIAAARQVDAERAKHKEVQNTLQDAAKQQRQIVADTGAEIDDLNQSFMASEIKAISDFNREQKRLREDLEADLLNAAVENDVNAFIRIRNQGLSALGRGDEDFSRERQQALDERNARIEELQRGQRQEIEQLNAQTVERLDTLQAAADVELTLAQQKEQQLADLKETFRQEDLRLEQEQQAQERSSRLNAFRQRIEEDSAALSKVLSQYSNAAQQLMQSFSGASLAQLAAASAAKGYTGAPAGLVSNFAPNVTVNNTVGDVASLSQARAIANNVGQNVVDGVGALFRSGGFSINAS